RLVPRRNSPALRKLSAELLPLDLRLVEEQIARLDGRAEISPPVPPAVLETSTLEHLVRFWAAHAAPRLQTVKDVKAHSHRTWSSAKNHRGKVEAAQRRG
ncbi:MAG TPA: hypothetical protein VIQ01_01770, partial [Burkholderiales bacterium]